MRPIIIVMLLIDIGIFLATAFTVAARTPTVGRLGSNWHTFALSLLITGATSIRIASDHPGKLGADLLAFAGPLLIGMAIMCVLVLLRDRRAKGVEPIA